MILTLTPNPAVDITYAVQTVTLGESHRVGDVRERAGGKGLNVAAVLAGLGRHALAVAPVGADELAAFATDLTERGVSHRLVESPRRTRRSVAVVDANGEATLFNEAGSAQPEVVWTRLLDTVVALAPQASVLTISGSLPASAPGDLVGRLSTEASRSGLQVVLDVGGSALARALGAGPTLVKPNRVEARSAVGLPRDAEPTAADLASALVDAGAGAAIVSDGVNGLQLRHGDVRLRARVREPLRGNPTGAGDALTASLAADLESLGGLPEGRDLWAEVLRRGVAWSAAAVLQPVAGVVDPADVERLLPSVEIEETLA
jgi:1-phosphofructokinase family hexose kinase